MPDATASRSRHVLEPSERIAEVLFGLIMVLTFTGSLSVADAGRDDVRAMLIGALGCNLAWGVIDGVLYLMGCLADRRRDARLVAAVHAAPDAAHAQRHLNDALPGPVADALDPDQWQALYDRLRQNPPSPAPASLTGRDWRGAVGVLLIVFLATLPVALPFVFFAHVGTAMRVSNAVAVGMLFAAGYAYGRCIGWRPRAVGLGMVILGSFLVAMTMALGG